MTKRRRKKLNRIMSDYSYIERGKFTYIYKQISLYRKHKSYLNKMSNHAWKKFTKELLEKYGGKTNG